MKEFNCCGMQTGNAATFAGMASRGESDLHAIYRTFGEGKSHPGQMSFLQVTPIGRLSDDALMNLK